MHFDCVGLEVEFGAEDDEFLGEARRVGAGVVCGDEMGFLFGGKSAVRPRDRRGKGGEEISAEPPNESERDDARADYSSNDTDA